MAEYELLMVARAVKKGDGFTEAAKDVDQLNSKVKESGQEADSFGSKLTANLSKVGLAFGTVAAAGVAAKKVFDFSREGAELNQLADSFDLLNQDVLQTPDLLDQMRSAAGGTIKDTDLMAGVLKLTAGATGEYSQTLAAISPQLLEIARASNKLNPQLGDTAFLYESLTTAAKRQSVPIADNLGLIIKMDDAVKKVHPSLQNLAGSYDELTDQQKFLNELLFQGGNLIDQVGGDVNSQADSWARLTVKVGESFDSLKRLAADGLLPVVEALDRLSEDGQAAVQSQFDQADALALTVDNLDDYIAALREAEIYFPDTGTAEVWYEQAKAQQAIVEAAEDAAVADQKLGQYIRETTAATDGLVEPTLTLSDVWNSQPGIMEQLNGRYEELRRNAEAQATAEGELAEAYQTTLDGSSLLVDSYDKLGTQYYTINGRTAEQQANLEELRSEYDGVQDSIRSLQGGTAGLGLSEDELNEKLAEQQERAAELSAAMAPLEAVKGEIASRDVEMAFNMDAVNQVMYDSAVAAGASATEVAMLDIARGNLTKTEAQAILTEAAVRVKAEELGREYAAGRITIQEMDAQMQDFITTMMEVPPSVRTEVSVESAGARAALDGVLKKLLDIDGKVARARVEVGGGNVPSIPSGGTSGGAGKTTTSKTTDNKKDYASGTRGWETVPAGFNNDDYTIGLSSGERFAVIPSGAGMASLLGERNGGGANNTTYQINIDARGASNPAAVYQAGYAGAQRALSEKGARAGQIARMN